MYYLQSRYYDPQIGRFVNANGQIDSNAGLVGTNLFSYTANNPVHSIDDSGSSLIVVAGAVLGGCAGGYAGYKIAESNGYTGWKKAGVIAAGAVVGGVAGGFCGYGINSIIYPATVVSTNISTLGDNRIHHILTKHSISGFQAQLNYINSDVASSYLSKNSFFNPNWTNSEIVDAATFGYNQALQANVINGRFESSYMGEKIIVVLTNGNFSTCYGTYHYTLEEFINLYGGS